MFLTYGKNPSNDELIHISEAERGDDCGLVCPFCDVPLTARKGNVVGHHFAHRHDSCRSVIGSGESVLPTFEGYFIYGLTKAQRQALSEIIEKYGDHRPFFAHNVGSRMIKALEAKNFLDVWRQQTDWESDSVDTMAILTEKGRAFVGDLSLFEFVRFMWAELELSKKLLQKNNEAGPDHQIALDILDHEVQRIKNTSLYFLEIKTSVQILHKIGITTRPIDQRISEIRRFLEAENVKVTSVEPLYYIQNVAQAEGYFKAKFAKNSYAVGNATEYFLFADVEPIKAEWAELRQNEAKLIPTDELARNSNRRPRFRTYFIRQQRKANEFVQAWDYGILLANITNLASGERVLYEC